MKITFLADNEAKDGLGCEWGLSMLVEHEGASVLLDAGATGLFAENARALGIDLAKVDACALSHAHFDHAGGFDEFCMINAGAPLWMRPCRENCYSDAKGALEYIGVPQGMLERLGERIRFVEGNVEIAPGIWALPHATAGLEAKGAAGRMLVGPDFEGVLPAAEALEADDFAHELTLAIDLGDSVVAINSCSHSGPDVVVAETMAAFPGKPVRALIGGFHLFMTSAEEVRALAGRLRELGVVTICAGHCTGVDSFRILQEELGSDVVLPTAAGLVLEL